MGTLTTSQVNKAGRLLRKASPSDAAAGAGLELSHARDILLQFRAHHQRPLAKATMGLRSVVNTENCERVEVSQRLKRTPTILDKLRREPTLALANMQDIGGCRAVLASIDEVRRVEARLRKNRPPVGYSDYVTTPRQSGYRGLQRLSGRIGENLKGDGAHAVQQLLASISRAQALEETGQAVDGSLLVEMEALRREAAPYLGGGPR